MDIKQVSMLLDRIIASNPVKRPIDELDRKKFGESFMLGVYTSRLEMLLNDLENLKDILDNE